MTMSRRTMRWATSLVAATVLVTTGGCGQEPAPDAAVPQLETALSRVDESIAGKNWERARQAVQKLISQTGAALEAGTLTQEQADRIQAAAARLLSELPDPAPSLPSSPPAPTDPETTQDGVDDLQEEEDEKREERRDDAEEQEDDDHEQGD